MYVLTGDPLDPLCKSVYLALESAGYQVCIVANPMLYPFRFVWRLETLNSSSRVFLEDETVISDSEISAVLVRRPTCLPADAGDPDDVVYIQEEADAALLAWLWSLDCIVVNRYPPTAWYRRDQPLVLWRNLLERSGLSAVDYIITNTSADLVAYQTTLGDKDSFVPLSSQDGELLNLDRRSETDLSLVNRAPTHLIQSGIEQERLCVIGSRVVWNESPIGNRGTIESALSCFRELSGLDFFELALSRFQDETRVAAVNPYPRLEDYKPAARTEIVAALVSLLTGNQSRASKEVGKCG
jgi:hypothetical protein